jgi:hypothetical protein
MLSVINPSVRMPSEDMLRVIILSVIMLGDNLLSVIILSVCQYAERHYSKCNYSQCHYGLVYLAEAPTNESKTHFLIKCVDSFSKKQKRTAQKKIWRILEQNFVSK